jgi:GAF domain-containing protein/ActR/RegA family two-component response regulator
LRPHSSYKEGRGSRKYQSINLGEGICGIVAAEGKAQRVADVLQDPDYLNIDPSTRSELCVPLKIGERIIGVINAESAQVGAFTETDERLLSTLAGQLATAIDRLRAESAMRRRAGQISILSRVSQEVVASLIPEQVYSAIHRATAQLMPTETFLITLLDETGQMIHPVYFVEKDIPVFAEPIPVERGLSGYVIATGNSLLVNDLDELDKIDIVHAGNPETSRSVLAVPMRLGGKIFGVLSCQSYRPRVYNEDDLQTLKTLANQAAIAIGNARLFAETQRRLAELTFISQIIAITATENDLTVALNRICSELAHFLQAPEVDFALLNSQLTSAQIIAEYHDPDRPQSLGMQIPVIGNPPLSHVLQRSTNLVVTDARNDPMMASMQDVVKKRELVSFLLVPIIFGGEVVGTLEIAYTKQREFSLAEVDLVEKVASQVGQVLERLGLFAATREQAERMAHLATLGEGLNRSQTLDEVIESIGEGAMALGQADRAALYIHHEDNRITASWARGLSEDYLSQVTSRVEEMPDSLLSQGFEPVLISDLEQIPESSLLRQLGMREGFRGVELWPLVYQDNVVAAIGCYYDHAHMISDAEQEVMRAFARQATVALQNARLFDETRRRATQLEALNAIITEVTAASDLNYMLETILDLTLRALGLKAGGIWVGGQWVIRGVPPQIVDDAILTPSSREMETSATLAISNWEMLEAGDLGSILQPAMKKYGIRASMIVPLLAEQRRIGGMSLVSATPRTWLPEEISLAEGVGRQLGGAIERLTLLEQIKENARRVQQIMDTVPEGVILLDNQRQVVLANPVAQDYLLELEGVHIGDTLGRLADKSLDELLRSDLEVLWTELEISQPAHRVFELAAKPIEEGEHSSGWVLVMREVTQERENQARIQMQERLATVGQLAAGIAHDFNNIMAAIIVYADLLKRDPNLHAASRDRLNIITQQVQRASSLIRQILDFSRRSVMEQSTLDLLPFIKELDKLLRRVLPENIRLELTYRPGVYMVNADPTRLQQVFMNLAVNARDASSKGGVLQFELERVQVLPDELPPCPDIPPGDWICISVKDSGEGIPPEAMPHIFEPFYTTKPVGQGTGLGLAQAYGIVKQHGGYIDAHSQVGQGTTFHIYLREQESIETESSPFEQQDEMKGGNETLLLVEDDYSTREAMRTLLEDYNYTVLTASNGAEALRIYENKYNDIALVISDLVMPELGGVALFQTLQERWPEVKFLFVTGHPMLEEERAVLEKGNIHWLQKPFSVQVFNQTVRSILFEAPTSRRVGTA